MKLHHVFTTLALISAVCWLTIVWFDPPKALRIGIGAVSLLLLAAMLWTNRASWKRRS